MNAMLFFHPGAGTAKWLCAVFTVFVWMGSGSVDAAANSPRTAVSIRRDVMPVFFRANCNSGGCHGAAVGKDGFRLSLFGYDPEGDHFRLTQQMVGRRIDHAIPEKSLLFLKATQEVPHTGGKLFAKGSPLYQTLLAWIGDGARDDGESVPVVTGIAVEPSVLRFEGERRVGKLRVEATYSDGSRRDVTSLCLFLTNNKTVANISEDGTVRAGARGRPTFLHGLTSSPKDWRWWLFPRRMPLCGPRMRNRVERSTSGFLTGCVRCASNLRSRVRTRSFCAG